jgi:hypothetical protein
MFLEREYLLAREKDLRRWQIPPKNTMTLPNLLFTSRIQKPLGNIFVLKRIHLLAIYTLGIFSSKHMNIAKN